MSCGHGRILVTQMGLSDVFKLWNHFHGHIFLLLIMIKVRVGYCFESLVWLGALTFSGANYHGILMLRSCDLSDYLVNYIYTYIYGCAFIYSSWKGFYEGFGTEMRDVVYVLVCVIFIDFVGGICYKLKDHKCAY